MAGASGAFTRPTRRLERTGTDRARLGVINTEGERGVSMHAVAA
jgi:hypothetical protein